MKKYTDIKKELEKSYPKGVEREYPDGESIPKELPAFYKLGNSEQNCANCKYYVPETKNCKLFDAKVRPNYWCKKWMA
jgi:High potential iron-sulfur protein